MAHGNPNRFICSKCLVAFHLPFLYHYWLFDQTKHSPDMFSHWHVPWLINSCPTSMPMGWSCQMVGLVVPFQRFESLVRLHASIQWWYLEIKLLQCEWKGSIRLLWSTSTSSEVVIPLSLPQRMSSHVYIHQYCYTPQKPRMVQTAWLGINNRSKNAKDINRPLIPSPSCVRLVQNKSTISILLGCFYQIHPDVVWLVFWID